VNNFLERYITDISFYQPAVPGGPVSPAFVYPPIPCAHPGTPMPLQNGDSPVPLAPQISTHDLHMLSHGGHAFFRDMMKPTVKHV
jgi:hypothetical protein